MKVSFSLGAVANLICT